MARTDLYEAVPKRINIRNNVIRKVGGIDFLTATGIMLTHTKDVNITNNDISDTAMKGFSQFAAFRDSRQLRDLPDSVVGNTRFERNVSSNYGNSSKVGLSISDAGPCIYFFGVRNSFIRGNYAFNRGKTDNIRGIFHQDRAGYNNLWSQNVAENPRAQQSYLIQRFNGGNLDVVMDDNYGTVPVGPETAETIGKFHLEPNAPPWSADAQAIINQAGLQPAYRNLIDDEEDGVNIAFGKPVFATSSSGSNSAQRAVDVNHTTFWENNTSSEGGSPSYWQVNLQARYVLNKVEIMARFNNNQRAARRNFEVRASNDPNFNSYVVLGSQGSKSFSYYPDEAPRFTDFAHNVWTRYIDNSNSYQYIRVIKTANELFNFAEFRAFGHLSGTSSPARPTAPNNFSASAVSSSRIDLSWNDNSNNETGFQVQFRIAGGTYANLRTTGADVQSTSHTGLQASTTYEYRVRAINSSGQSAWVSASARTQSGSGNTGGGTVYRIENRLTGKWLYSNSESAPVSNGTFYVTQRENSFTGDRTRWRFVDAGDGYFRIENLSTGLWLQSRDETAPVGGSDADWVVTKDNTNTGDRTRWRTIDVGNGFVRLENKQTGRWLQGRDEDTPLGAGIDYVVGKPITNTGDRTMWKLIEEGGETPVGEATYRIENKLTDNWLQSRSEAAPVATGTFYAAQVPNSFTGDLTRWKLVDAGDGYFRIENVGTGYWLQSRDEVAPVGGNDALWVVTKDNTNTGDRTRWRTVDAGNGYVRLENKQTGRWLQGRDEITPVNSSASYVVGRSTTSTGDRTRWKLIEITSSSRKAELPNADELAIRVYPNPASEAFSIDLRSLEGTSDVTISDLTGRVILSRNLIGGLHSIQVAGWNPGVYFINVQNRGFAKISKLVVE